MKRIRRLVAVLCVLLVLCPLAGVTAAADVSYALPEGTTVAAQSAMVVYLGSTMEQDTVLFEKEAERVCGPAALVRMMVGAVALREIKAQGLDMDATHGTYTSALFYEHIGGTGLSVANMAIGETWTLRDLLTTSLIVTAADAAVTLAETVCGSVEAFVEKMNALADELGCRATSFANVTGNSSLAQYTTARDLYRITRYAMSFAEFEALIAKSQHTVTPVSGGAKRTFVTTNNMMRSSTSQYYAPMVFGRAGYTGSSGWSLLSVSRDSGYDYMVIVLGCESGAHYTDTRALYRWAFGSFSFDILLSREETVAHIPVELAWNKDRVALVPAQELTAVVHNSLAADGITRRVTLYAQSLDAPIRKGTVYGKVELITNVDQVIGEVELVAAESIEKSGVLVAWRWVTYVLRSPWLYVCAGSLLLAIVLAALLKGLGKRRR